MPKTVRGKLGWVEDGSYAASRNASGVFTTNSSLRMPPTWAIQNAGMRECVLNVGLHELVNVSAGGTSYITNSIESRIAPVTTWNSGNPEQLTVSIRLHVGDRAPAYWSTVCGSVTVSDGNFNKLADVPIWWENAYRTQYTAAMAALAPTVDSLDVVKTINAPGAAFFYPEPFLKFANSTVDAAGTTNGQNLIAAGYTEAKDRSFNEWFPTASAVFTNTVVALAINPSPFVSATGGTTTTDQTHCRTVADILIASMPVGHAQIENYSAREDHMTGTGFYQNMYNWMQTKTSVAWIGVQMARPHEVAQTDPDNRQMWDDVAAFFANKGFHFVETTGPNARPLNGSGGVVGLANIWPTTYEDDAALMSTIGTQLFSNARPFVASAPTTFKPSYSLRKTKN